MSFFLKQLLTERGYQHLFFYSFHSCTGLHYHVSVCCKNELAAIYRLKNSEGKWLIEDPADCPGWLMAMEERLNDAIQKHKEA